MFKERMTSSKVELFAYNEKVSGSNPLSFIIYNLVMKNLTTFMRIHIMRIKVYFKVAFLFFTKVYNSYEKGYYLFLDKTYFYMTNKFFINGILSEMNFGPETGEKRDKKRGSYVIEYSKKTAYAVQIKDYDFK